MNVEVLVWCPTTGRLGRPDRDWTRANCRPLSPDEAEEVAAMLRPMVDDYRGQGMTIHGVRVTLE